MNRWKMPREWKKSFKQFVDDMGEKPSKKHSMDRIDNDKGYSKENCRWAIKLLQIRNARPKKNLSCGVPGVSKIGSKFRARILFNGARTCLGIFKTIEEASNAYNKCNEKILSLLNNLDSPPSLP